MAIQWGAWTANDRWRIGLDVSYSGSPSSGSVTVKADLWFQVRYASSEHGQSGTRWGITGAAGSDTNNQFDWGLGSNGSVKLGSSSATQSLTYGSTKRVTVNGSASVAFTYPGSGSVSVSITLPARPYSAPAAPSGASLSRGTGESLTATWARNATTAAPYEYVEVQRTNSGAPGSWWATVRLSGSATSYALQADADRKYRVRIRAGNSAGVSAWLTSSEVSTTPATPGTPSAGKNSAGDIVVSFSGPASGSSATQYEVWHAANGVWDGARLALVTAATGSYTHVNPNAAQTHAYRLRAVSSGPTLYSGYSGTSATVQLQAPPNAPTSLSPNGAVLDHDVSFRKYWKHNPVDSTPQTAFELEYRISGETAWRSTGGKVPWQPSDAARPFPADDVAVNGQTIEWRVRTWGAHANPSPWSNTATITFSSPPSVTINTPDGVDPVASSRVTVTWGYYQAEGKPQAQWSARLKGATGAVLETLSGASDTVSSATFKTAVQDGATYSVEVRVQSAAGLWSDWSSQAFTVDYPEPPAPSITAWWQPGDGVVSLDVEQPAPGDGGVEAVTVQVWRAVDGDDWRLIAEVEPGVSVTDFIPALGRINFYRATAVSALPSQMDSDVVEVLTDGAKHVFVNAGPGFSQTIRLASNVEVGMSGGRAKTLRRARGRRFPVEFAGDQRSHEINVSATLWDGRMNPGPAADASAWEDVQDLADLPAPACYRDPDGRRYFMSVGEPQISGLGKMAQTVSVTLTRTDWAEPVGSDA